MKLKEKQIRFCEEYLVDLNATQAAIRAGYSEKTAHSIGFENLIKPELQLYLEERRKQIANSLNITQEKVLKEYAKIAFSDIRKFYNQDGALKPIHDLDDDSAAAIAGIETHEEKVSDPGEDEIVVAGQTRKIKTYDKIKALDSICKVLGYNSPERKDETVNKKVLLTIVRKNGAA